MKFLGILRASALCLLISAFCSQHASCGLFKSKKKPNEPATVEVSEVSENPENPEESTVKSEVSENPENPEESTVKSEVSENPENPEESTVKSEVSENPENPEESTVKSEVSENPENPEESTVKSEAAESSENPGESGVRSSGSENTSQVSGPSAYERELDEQLRIMAEQRKEAVERLLESDAPFSFKDMELFLGVLKKGADVDPEDIQKVGQKIHAFLGSFGIHGEDAKASLETLLTKRHKAIMDLVYGPLDIDIFNPA